MKKYVFIINAHPDDLIGTAGLALILAGNAGYELKIVDFSRGERGLAHQNVPMAECAAMRTIEEKNACALLGVEPIFLDEIDGEISAPRETCEELAALFRQFPPCAVFTHWPVDRHIDHVMTGAATLNALRIAQLKPEVFFHHQTPQTLNMPFLHYIGFGERIMQKKCELIRHYVCQNGDHLADRKLCEGRFLGFKAQMPYAEAYGSYQLAGESSAFFGSLPRVTE